MKINNFDDLKDSKDQQRVIKEAAIDFIKLNILDKEGEVAVKAKLSDSQKKLFVQVLNHLEEGKNLHLNMEDIENFEKAEETLRPNLNSNENLIMFFLYLLCRCSFESASSEVLKVWKDVLVDFELPQK